MINSSLRYLLVLLAAVSTASAQTILSGKAAIEADWTADAPGVRHKITVADLPPPYQTGSALNDADVVKRPDGAQFRVPPGFKIELYAAGFRNPRYLLTAPNGDIFVDRKSRQQIKVLRDADGDGKPETTETFTTDGLNQPFGLAFYPPGPRPAIPLCREHGRRDPFPVSQWRPESARPGRKTQRGTLRRRALARRRTLDTRPRLLPRWQENVCLDRLALERLRRPRRSRSRPHLRVQPRRHRAKSLRLGRAQRGRDQVPPRVQRALDERERTRRARRRPRARLHQPRQARRLLRLALVLHREQSGPAPQREKARAREQSHRARRARAKPFREPESCFYEGAQFPAEYKGDIFAAFHGSWNKKRRTGYKIVRVPIENGKARGDYEDFVTGFVTPEGKVWGRPVGITVAKDGSLLFSEDGNDTIWRVSYPK